ncbi:hypothetical protein CW362_29890 [Streptomyces populi]|uniref:Uncharacterized protein n=1 Tax=Streptomyces populi TaxID=2058924 RepID=A0A2I0SHI9_9ACTN|nr:hypothetical protein CW362_29890 [Streptomyces populi]
MGLGGGFRPLRPYPSRTWGSAPDPAPRTPERLNFPRPGMEKTHVRRAPEPPITRSRVRTRGAVPVHRCPSPPTPTPHPTATG